MLRQRLYRWNYHGLWAIAAIALLAWPQVGTAAPRQPSPAPVPPGTPRLTNVQAAAAQVEQVLNQDVTLRPFRLQVQSQGNVLVLMGVVNTQAEKRLAVQLAQRTAPSFPIDNRIQAASQ